MEEEVKIFKDLFFNVLQVVRSEFLVDDLDIKMAALALNFTYSPEGQNLGSTDEPVDYNNPAYRCAYLHKYAGCHAAMIDHVLSYYVIHTSGLKYICHTNSVLSVCCLGAGPGTDIIGLWSILLQELRIRGFRFTAVDCMKGWTSTFQTVLKVASSEPSGVLDGFLSRLVSQAYICDDLVSPSEETLRAVASADLVTMVKFISAVNPKQVTGMLKVLFKFLKCNAVVLFIDNAAGGFDEMFSEAAAECCLMELIGPLRHIKFESEVFKEMMFGSYGLSSTTVTVQMWMKSDT